MQGLVIASESVQQVWTAWDGSYIQAHLQLALLLYRRPW